MNFLGHLYFSNGDHNLMYANLQGDYIKGKNLSHHSLIVQKGVSLHRTIDDYIDTHQLVLELLRSLYPLLPKVSGIAVDLYFDHLLAREWTKFHPDPLREFIDQFYEHIPHFQNEFNPEFAFMLSKMKEFDWLYHYRTLNGLHQASSGLSRRISFENDLYKARDVFELKRTDIESCFDSFMQDARPFFQNYFKKN